MATNTSAQPKNDETVITLEEQFPFLAEFTTDSVVEHVLENIAPNSITGLDQLSVPAHGQWEKPVLMSEKPLRFDALRGVIVAARNFRLLWESQYDPNEKTAPICSSDDGIHGWGQYGSDPETGEPSPNSKTFGRCFIDSKHMCPMAEFTETIDAKGNKKTARPKCSQKVLLFVVLEGDSTPTRIVLSPTSLTTWNKYSQRIQKVGKTGTYGVVTELTLDSKGKFSIVNFRETAVLNAQQAAIAKAYGDAIQAAFPPRHADKIIPLASIAARKTVAALPSGGSDGATVDSQTAEHSDF